jgi:hypothetical protein
MNRKSRTFIAVRLRPWIEARSRWSLSHLHVQMARELGMNPNKLGKLAKHGQEPWKLPLPDFIVRIHVERFGKMPDFVKDGRRDRRGGDGKTRGEEAAQTRRHARSGLIMSAQ